MVAGALTFPLIGDNGTGTWANQLGNGDARAHPADACSGSTTAGWRSPPMLAAVAAAIAFAALATPRTRLGDLRPALAAVLGWAVVSVVGPTVAGDPITPLGDGPAALSLVGGRAWRPRWRPCWRCATASAAPSAPPTARRADAGPLADRFPDRDADHRAGAGGGRDGRRQRIS